MKIKSLQNYRFSILCIQNKNCATITLVKNGICIDSTLIDSTVSCVEIYDQVCGCDSITYSN